MVYNLLTADGNANDGSIVVPALAVGQSATLT